MGIPEKVTRDNAGIDLLKFIMAILVITIHTGPLLSYGRVANGVLTQILARIAVPFFFFAAGYFFCRKYAVDGIFRSGYLKKYLLHLGKLYLIWTGVFLLSLAALNQPMPWEENDWHWYSWGFMGVYGLLWFFLVLLAGIAVWAILYKVISRRLRIVLMLIFYIVSCLPGIPPGVGAYAAGAGLVGAGMLLAESPAVLPSCWYWSAVAGAFLGEALVWYGNECLGLHLPHGIFWLPGAAALFAFGMNWTVPISGRNALRMRKLSTYLYVTHGIVSLWLQQFIEFDNSLLYFLSVFTASLLFSAVIAGGVKLLERRSG